MTEIRRYQENDEVEELIRKSVASERPGNYSEEELDHLEDVIPGMNLDFADEERYTYYVAVEKDKVLGLAGLQKDSGKVGGIFVDPEHKGEGIGSQLLERLEEKASEKELEKIEALASLDAIDFYRKNGYETVEEVERDVEGKEIAMLLMEKEL